MTCDSNDCIYTKQTEEAMKLHGPTFRHSTPCRPTCCAPSPPLKTTKLCRMRSCSVCLPLVASARPFRSASAAFPSCNLRVHAGTTSNRHSINSLQQHSLQHSLVYV